MPTSTKKRYVRPAMPEDNLLNCPFCAGTYYDLDIHEDPVYKPEIVCTNCGATMQGETFEDAKRRWNTRPK